MAPVPNSAQQGQPQVTPSSGGQFVTSGGIDPNVQLYVDTQLKAAFKEAKDLKKDILTSFSIFTSLLIFASLEVQVLTKAPRFSIMVGLSAFFAAALLTFAICIHHILHERTAWVDYKTPLFFLPGVLFMTALLCFCYAFLFPSGSGLIVGAKLMGM